MNKATLVLGASNKSNRYSNLVARLLQEQNHDVILIGNRSGMINEMPILIHWPKKANIHTITMYLSSKNQIPYYDDILTSGVERIIFNPGSENPELAKFASDKGIMVENACTLVLLSTYQY